MSAPEGPRKIAQDKFALANAVLGWEQKWDRSPVGAARKHRQRVCRSVHEECNG